MQRREILDPSNMRRRFQDGEKPKFPKVDEVDDTPSIRVRKYNSENGSYWVDLRNEQDINNFIDVLRSLRDEEKIESAYHDITDLSNQNKQKACELCLAILNTQELNFSLKEAASRTISKILIIESKKPITSRDLEIQRYVMPLIRLLAKRKGSHLMIDEQRTQVSITQPLSEAANAIGAFDPSVAEELFHGVRKLNEALRLALQGKPYDDPQIQELLKRVRRIPYLEGEVSLTERLIEESFESDK